MSSPRFFLIDLYAIYLVANILSSNMPSKNLVWFECMLGKGPLDVVAMLQYGTFKCVPCHTKTTEYCVG